MNSTAFSEFDRHAMARALEVAERGAETAHPNPRVGCVIARNGEILAEGWHERAGGPHAEIAALNALALKHNVPDVGRLAAGATAYVNLEPCSHHGRTPPCTDALIAARVARVVFSIQDPNPQVAGTGALALKRAGIDVVTGLMAAEAEELNIGFLMRMRQGRPFVRIKIGMSTDGRTALPNGVSKWITGDAARKDVQLWRARSSAILTGIGTVLADDPQLNVRRPAVHRPPLRVILDSRLRTPPTARVVDTCAPTLIFAAEDPTGVAGSFVEKGVEVENITPTKLPLVMTRLGELGVNELLVEAGANVSGAFVQAGFADELLLYMAPRFLGPYARPLLTLPKMQDLAESPQFQIIEHRLIGDDLRLRMRPAPPAV